MMSLAIPKLRLDISRHSLRQSKYLKKVPCNTKHLHKPTVLMAVFHPLADDGRVKRSLAHLSGHYEVTVLSPMRSDTAAGIDDLDSQLIASWFRWQKLPNALGLALFWIQLFWLAVKERPKVVYVHDFYLPFIGFLAAQASGARCIYDAHEIIIPSRHRKTSVRGRFFYWLEKAVVNRVDVVIAANDARARLMRCHYKLKGQPVVVGNFVSPTIGAASTKELILRYPQLAKDANEKIVIYAGVISEERRLSEFIEAFRFMPRSVRFVLIGDGPDLQSLKARYDDLSAQVSFIGHVRSDWVQDIMALCDIGVLSYPLTSLNNIYCAPNKLYEYAEAGIPVLATSQHTFRKVIKDYNAGVLLETSCNRSSALHIARSFEKLIDNYEEHVIGIRKFQKSGCMLNESPNLVAIISGLC